MLKDIRNLFQDKRVLVAAIAMFILVVVEFVIVTSLLRPGDIQVVVRYTPFGFSFFYRDHWYYLLTFILFAVAVFVTHILVASNMKKRIEESLLLPFVWLGVLILAGLCIESYKILRIASLS